jgi:hypothetical protein
MSILCGIAEPIEIAYRKVWHQNSMLLRLLEDFLSPLGMFDTDGYHPGSLADVKEYRSVIWTHQKRSVPSTIIVYQCM